jgi:hypothetical protein
MIEEEIGTTKIEILIEEKEDALIVVKEDIRLETADKRDILIMEEKEDPDLEAGQDQDLQAMIDTVEEEDIEAEKEAMKIQEVEEEIGVEEMITEGDNHRTAEVTAMIAEEMEKSIQEIAKIKNKAEAGTQDQIQDTVNKREDQEIINTVVKKESMDRKNLKAKTKKAIMEIEIKEVQEEVSLTTNNLEAEAIV